MDRRKFNGGHKNAGRKRGIGITYDIKKHCQKFIEELLSDEAIRIRAANQLAESLKEETKDYLYILKVDSLYKIGYSSNWSKRKKSYDTHLPSYHIIYIINGFNAYELENELHLMFSEKRKNGEWFDLSDNDLVKAVSYCSNRIN